jgi:pyruvate dehydrogenase E2 component (dihydrolipoamide acetyltransferase)
MAEKVLMPQLSDTMETGIIVDWKVEEGEEVKTGDILAEVETDKATMELEAFDSGVLLKKIVAEGDEVPTQELIAVIGEEGEDISDLIEVAEETGGETEEVKEEGEEKRKEEEKEREEPGEDKEQEEKGKEEPEEETTEQSSGRAGGKRFRISPVARKISDEHGIDVSKIEGSGSEGRITKKDVEKAIESGAAKKTEKAPSEALKSEKVELSSMRRTIARRMSKSKREIPHFHLQTEIDMGNTVSLREDFRDDEQEVSYNDFILLSAVRALLEVPELNVSYEEDYLQKYGHINLAFAVALEDGLITPVIENAQNLNLFEIQKASRRLAEKARQGKLNPEQYNNGTFTVSNLGMYGITNFSAVINPPQAAILAVGTVEERPVSREGEIVSVPRMSVTLSCDHRAVDGSQGARYLQVLKELLEHPGRLVFS